MVMYHNERRLTQKLRDEAGRKKERKLVSFRRENC